MLSRYFDIKRDPEGREYMEVYTEGIALLRLSLTNKGTAFTQEERSALGLEGLLPPRINTLDQQLQRVYRGFVGEPTPIAKYRYLRALQERHEMLFFALLQAHLEEMLPIVDTPTVGEAAEKFNYLYQGPRGLSLSPLNIAHAKQAVVNYPFHDVRMVVATDASAILGMGDQGYGGLAIPIGKLSIYTVAGGISPFHTMAASLDVGTDREDLIEDAFYLGVRQKRLRGAEYFAFLDRFVEAVRERFPRAIMQWEDFSRETAFAVLERYRKVLPSFNDDIQCTGAMALAGLRSACRLKGEALRDQRVVVHGAGASGLGVAWALTQWLMHEGLSAAQAAARIYVLDSKGLLRQGRPLDADQARYCQPREVVDAWKIAGDFPNLMETVVNSRATALIGLSAQPRCWSEALVRTLAKNTDRPIVLPLAHAATMSEASPEDLLAWTDGKAIVATGAPCPAVTFRDVRHAIANGNSSLIFPGLGLAATVSEAREITDAMVLEASSALAEYTQEKHPLAVFPPANELPQIAVCVAARVIKRAVEEGVAQRTDIPREGLEAYVQKRFWRAGYLPMRRG